MIFLNRFSSLKKRSFLIPFLLLAFSLAYFFSHRPSDTQVLVNSVMDGKLLNSQNKLTMNPPSASNDVTSIEVMKSPSVNINTPAEIIDWRRAHGYFSNDELTVYKGYSNQVLEDLLNNGDLKAAVILGDRVLDLKNDPDYRKRYAAVMFKAAAHGSTWALSQVAVIAVPGDKLNDSAYQRKALMSNLALYRVASIRGDINKARLFATVDTEYYEKKFGALALTETERQKIENMANLHYKRLEEYRAKLGLPPFDNSTPELIKLQFEQEGASKN